MSNTNSSYLFVRMQNSKSLAMGFCRKSFAKLRDSIRADSFLNAVIRD
ncbi:hypothetical protein LEP1GSC060_2672 [Leptospira weilii serovar Ranarum str. ICFT]|uniref:Uncharacterized protein n=1 Tax=Leptospira weilii serovar Ranarum str. ICFT TaxID=1218598 RepID=N1WKP4_9LEPT|nr:hypothetical protein LEP1GSC060_2672 [Leptospira weilii serovar Ranarum str. ICFT]